MRSFFVAPQTRIQRYTKDTMTGEKYNITYSKGALREVDRLTKELNLKDRKETLDFALVVLKQLQEKGNVFLKR